MWLQRRRGDFELVAHAISWGVALSVDHVPTDDRWVVAMQCTVVPDWFELKLLPEATFYRRPGTFGFRMGWLVFECRSEFHEGIEQSHED